MGRKTKSVSAKDLAKTKDHAGEERDAPTQEIRPSYYRALVRARDPNTGEYLPIQVEVECFDLLDALGLRDHYYQATAFRYLWRAGKKTRDRLEDLRKALTFVDQAVRRHRHIELKDDPS